MSILQCFYLRSQYWITRMYNVLFFTEMFWIIICYLTGYSGIEADLCSDVLTLDCEHKYVAARDEGVCGTNGISYANFCYYSQAKCKNATLNIKHVGLCSQWNTTNNPKDSTATETMNDTFRTSVINTTTVSPAITISTTKDKVTDYDPMQHVFCSSFETGTIMCPKELDPYCGNDGSFYMNKCHFESAKCKNDTLSEQPLNMCKGTIPEGSHHF